LAHIYNYNCYHHVQGPSKSYRKSGENSSPVSLTEDRTLSACLQPTGGKFSQTITPHQLFYNWSTIHYLSLLRYLILSAQQDTRPDSSSGRRIPRGLWFDIWIAHFCISFDVRSTSLFGTQILLTVCPSVLRLRLQRIKLKLKLYN